ncbi:MAG TPA: cytochrome c maturation protein CcmE [Aggregatilineales bacterium]|nr:cytochrome c maturation protein CcmE [Aggregatilineales bacterium]
MATSTWEKSLDVPSKKFNIEKLKFLVGGMLIFGAIAYLIIMNTFGGVQYFITVNELLSDSKYAGQTVRISGAVIGKTIQYDDKNLVIDFTIAHIETTNEDLAYALYLAAADESTAQRLQVHIENQVKPDLLQNEAQAILTGKLGDDGIFYATEILLKCPSRYEDNVPNQAISGGDL